MNSRTNQRGASIYLKALATLGPGWALQRTKLLLLNKLGVLERRTPLHPWNTHSLDGLLNSGVPTAPERYCEWRRLHSAKFLFSQALSEQARAFIGEGSIRQADSILNGEFSFFGYAEELGFPPNWQRNPATGEIAPGGHWSKSNESSLGDVKFWWEASRFSWAFTLGRAYGRVRDQRYAEAFWTLLESWMEQNPPQWGINWKCGQEASIRAMALCFGFHVFADSHFTTPKRIAQFIALIRELALRIESYIEYALSQKNNHGISEGTGLWTIGLLFPELRHADKWRRRGKQVIESEVQRQIYSDGSYVQHSTNYHRVMLQVVTWALRLGECNGDELVTDVYDMLRKSTQFLAALTDSETGHAPNCGANDGALILPLTDCDFLDMRPALQSSYFLTEKQRLYPCGPWDEEMMWINGQEAMDAAPLAKFGARGDLDADSGGYYLTRSTSSWAMMRASRYKDRPSHADQLHIDLWWLGENVLCDAGTYSYNAPIPFEHAFAPTRFHNTVTVDSADQMTRIGRFLWADWAHANAFRPHAGPVAARSVQAEHDGYRKAGVFHRRALSQPGENIWIVVDDIVGDGAHTTRLHWLTPEVPFEMASPDTIDLTFLAGTARLVTASSSASARSLVCAGVRVDSERREPGDAAMGWRSRYYGRKEPALSFSVECPSQLPVRFVTVILLGEIYPIQVDSACMNIVAGRTRIVLSPVGNYPIGVQIM